MKISSLLSGRLSVAVVVFVLACVLLVLPVQAFNPPVDKVGPLTVRIEFPKTVDKVGVPTDGCVIIENEGDRAISGQLALEMVDRWKIEPAGPVRFYVDAAPSGTGVSKEGKSAAKQVKPNVTRIPFKATAGAGTYAGKDGVAAIYYPIHARATFELEGQEKTAHPICLFRTTFPWTSAVEKLLAAKKKWAPLSIEADSALRLVGESMQRTFVVLRDKTKAPILEPIGFNGSEKQTGALSSEGVRTGSASSGKVVVVHPPFRDGQLGTVVREYPVRLPKVQPIKFDFDVAVSARGPSDGVTFGVRVADADAPEGTLGELVFEKHSAVKEGWDPCTADLSRFAGRDVRIQLEAGPGPEWNTNSDSACWNRLRLTAGNSTPKHPFPPTDNEGFHRLGTIRMGGHAYEVQVRPGKCGLLDADVGFLGEDGKKLYFHGFEVSYTGRRIDTGETSVRLRNLTTRTGDGFYEVCHHFLGEYGPMDLTVRLQLKENTLQASFGQTHEKYVDAISNTGVKHAGASPAANGKSAASVAANHSQKSAPPAWTPIHLTDISVGPWSDRARQIYHGFGHVVRNPEDYRLLFCGHLEPTSFVGFDFAETFSMVQGVDNPPLSFEVQHERNHYSLHTSNCPTLTFIPTPNAFQGAKQWRKVNGLKASPGVAKVAGRFVFDLWGGYKYKEVREGLEKSFRYGLTDAMVIRHNWQRWGYDYRLPEIYPPNPNIGPEEELKALINLCKAVGVPFALHDNYIDLYPDANGFSYEKHVAFHPDGRPQRGWLNEGREALSYKYSPRSIMPFLKPNLKLIRENLAPTAYFIDVWTSAGPRETWTSTGEFVTSLETRKAWGEAFAWIRDYLGDNAPQISESGHDQLIGYLDGAQTNHLRIVPTEEREISRYRICLDCEDQERICWFDVAHHDRFVLHGAGYSYRYAGGLDLKAHGIDSDDYISTEVLTGHPGMVRTPFGREVVRKYWLIGPLMRALALRTVEQVDFDGGPRGDIHRQHVAWSGDGQVWVNRGESDWQVEGRTLPQYGFLARAATKDGPVEASIERRDGLIIERATSPKHLYFNARPMLDPRLKAQLFVEKVEPEGNHLKISMKAVIQEKAPEGYHLFFHITRDDKILEQPGHDMALFRREPGEYRFTVTSLLPKYAKPGDNLAFTYGLWKPGGDRYPLVGHDNGRCAIVLGVFEASKHKEDSNTSKVVWKEDAGESFDVAKWEKRFNRDGRMVDFGAVVTNGGCRLAKEGNGILVTPLPINVTPPAKKAFKPQTIRINPSELPWNLPKLVSIESLDEQGVCVAKREISRSKDGFFIEIPSESGVFAYRLSPK